LVQAEKFRENFKMIYHRQSKHYTICAFPQDFMAVYFREY
jgi:hypothetical protein